MLAGKEGSKKHIGWTWRLHEEKDKTRKRENGRENVSESEGEKTNYLDVRKNIERRRLLRKDNTGKSNLDKTKNNWWRASARGAGRKGRTGRGRRFVMLTKLKAETNEGCEERTGKGSGEVHGSSRGPGLPSVQLNLPFFLLPSSSLLIPPFFLSSLLLTHPSSFSLSLSRPPLSFHSMPAAQHRSPPRLGTERIKIKILVMVKICM